MGLVRAGEFQHRIAGEMGECPRAVGSILGVSGRNSLKVMGRDLHHAVAKCLDLLRFSSSAVR